MRPDRSPAQVEFDALPRLGHHRPRRRVGLLPLAIVIAIGVIIHLLIGLPG